MPSKPSLTTTPDKRLAVLAEHLRASGYLRSWSYAPELPCPFVFQPLDPVLGGPLRGWSLIMVDDFLGIALTDIPLLLAAPEGFAGQYVHTGCAMDRRFLEARLELGI